MCIEIAVQAWAGGSYGSSRASGLQGFAFRHVLADIIIPGIRTPADDRNIIPGGKAGLPRFLCLCFEARVIPGGKAGLPRFPAAVGQRAEYKFKLV